MFCGTSMRARYVLSVHLKSCQREHVPGIPAWTPGIPHCDFPALGAYCNLANSQNLRLH